MTSRRRLDTELVRRGLVASREQAQVAIAAGEVLVRGTVADKASRLVDPAEPVALAAPPARFVSRGGLKLEAALDEFAIDVGGRRALDAGASTGGFTDCLLQRGAAEVVAVDVGRGQLHQRLAVDARVDSRERTDIRNLTLAQVGGRPFDLIVADLSFISLRSVLAVLLGSLAVPGADVVTLVKPQFEAGRQAASAGRGVIRDPSIWSATLTRVISAMTAGGASMMGLMVSPLTGAEGNVEFLAYCRAHASREGDEQAPEAAPPSAEQLVAAAVGRAARRHGIEYQ
ncbi:MAG TPA: TlyA family RNA methyltransferase [Acidimicrobiales bacterium]|jgi:23S rRNA (cytidine1920-2'-O)/16S rRNA (cytidine1409-2'-O)-methyltransferase|nr:TlyA family RNA methyltransferase [Acidimicrobiales bacterium]